MDNDVILKLPGLSHIPVSWRPKLAFIAYFIGALVFAYAMIFRGGEVLDKVDELKPSHAAIVDPSLRERHKRLKRLKQEAKFVTTLVDGLGEHFNETEKNKRRRRAWRLLRRRP